MQKTELQKRLPSLLKDLRMVKGWDQNAFAQKIGASQGTVSRWESGKQEPEYEALRAIAAIAGKSVEAFLGYSVRVGTVNLLPVTVRGALKAGAWVEAVEWAPDEQFEIMVPEDKRYLGLTHAAFRIDGPSMNKLYPDGSYVIAVPCIELQGAPRPGDKVICQQSRSGLVEATVKELAVSDGKQYLWPRSDHPDHQTPILLDDSADEIVITGVVIGCYRRERD